MGTLVKRVLECTSDTSVTSSLGSLGQDNPLGFSLILWNMKTGNDAVQPPIQFSWKMMPFEGWFILRKSWKPYFLEKDLQQSSLHLFGIWLQNTKLIVVINHKKMDRENEEKKDISKSLPPFLVGFFFFNFFFWQPNNTSCLREAFMVYNLRPINRWLLLTNTHTHTHIHFSFYSDISRNIADRGDKLFKMGGTFFSPPPAGWLHLFLPLPFALDSFYSFRSYFHLHSLYAAKPHPPCSYCDLSVTLDCLF